MAGIDITTNIGCKNACIYCAQDAAIQAYRKRSKEMMMSFDTFKTCLNKIPLSIGINFAGRSECWLNPDCTKMILYAHERGYPISVLTTLAGCNPADIDLIEKIPFYEFLVHLPSNEGYENIKVDEEYLSLLKRVSNSAIKVSYMIVAGSLHDKVKLLLGDKIDRHSSCREKAFSEVNTLAGNAMVKVHPVFKRRGVINCVWGLRHNALLPNGDVSLCCLDFGMKHILGNLMFSDFDSLFRSEEFSRVKRGLRDPSLDTLCRYCDLVRHEDMFARIYNPIACHLKEIRNFKDFCRNFKRIPRFLRTFTPS